MKGGSIFSFLRKTTSLNNKFKQKKLTLDIFSVIFISFGYFDIHGCNVLFIVVGGVVVVSKHVQLIKCK